MTRPHSSYGWVAKLGLIVPPTNTVNEAEWQRMLREVPGVTMHVARMPLHLDAASAAGRRALERDLRIAIGSLQAGAMDVIAYGCTAGSMVSPLDALTRFMEAECGVPCATTASALVLAARALGLRRIAVATPYDERLNRHEAEYLQAHGLEVVRILGLGIGAGGPHEYPRIAQVPQPQVFEHLTAAWRDAADGMIVSCTDFPTLDSIAPLEARVDRPVITSNTATLWRCLRLAGVEARIAGAGRLFLEA